MTCLTQAHRDQIVGMLLERQKQAITAMCFGVYHPQYLTLQLLFERKFRQREPTLSEHDTCKQTYSRNAVSQSSHCIYSPQERSCCEKLWVANKILNSICGSLNMLKLTQMFILMSRITVVDYTGDFQKYMFLLRVSVYSNPGSLPNLAVNNRTD